MCSNPRFIRNAKGSFMVPCGICYSCLSNRRNIWTFRNLVEMFHSKSSYFITLTYSDAYFNELPTDPDTLIPLPIKSHYQNFLKQIRKEYSPNKLRYFGCHEYGKNTHRPHYHLIFYWSDPIELLTSDIQQFWKYGFVSCDKLNQARIHYCSKYLQKDHRFEYFKKGFTLEMEEQGYSTDAIFAKYKRYIYKKNSFNIMSRKPGIGYQLLNPDFIYYVRQNTFQHKNYARVMFNGMSFPLPKYFKDKIFFDYEKAFLYPHVRDNLEKNEFFECERLNIDLPDLRNNRFLKDKNKIDAILNHNSFEIL